MQLAESTIELWRRIPDRFPYEASSLGRIRNGQTGRVLNQYRPRATGYRKTRHVPGCRYWTVMLGRTWKSQLVHRLVAAAFHGASHLCVNHRSGNRHDNTPQNLEWVTPSENNRHAIRAGLMKAPPPQEQRGERNRHCTLTDLQVEEIRKLYATRVDGRTLPPAERSTANTLVNIARMFGVWPATIAKIGELQRRREPTVRS